MLVHDRLALNMDRRHGEPPTQQSVPCGSSVRPRCLGEGELLPIFLGLRLLLLLLLLLNDRRMR
jgi:hypothetical protein